MAGCHSTCTRRVPSRLLGRPQPFDAGAHTAFQVLLRAYAPPVSWRKKTGSRAVLAGEKPQDYLVVLSRAERRVARVALRQMLHTHQHPGSAGLACNLDRGAETPDAAHPILTPSCPVSQAGRGEAEAVVGSLNTKAATGGPHQGRLIADRTWAIV